MEISKKLSTLLRQAQQCQGVESFVGMILNMNNKTTV
jgi:hypothetical protein